MRIGRIIITREHPTERALRRYGELSPELRELIARVVRSTAKDHVQDVMEAQGLAYNPDGHPATIKHSTAGLVAPDNPHYISRATALRALQAVEENASFLAVEALKEETNEAQDAQRQRAEQGLKIAYELVRGHK